MSRVLTGDDMINSARRRTFTPDDTSTFKDQDILDVIDEELNAQVLDKLKELHGENLTVSEDVPKNSKGVYEIPYRALGNTLRDVSMVSGNSVYELSQISMSELPDYSADLSSGNNVDAFYIENNTIILTNPNGGYDSLRLRYMLRPNMLTKLEEAAVISEVNVNEIDQTLEIVVESTGKNFKASADYDIVGGKSPNKIKFYDMTIDSVTTGNAGRLDIPLSYLNGNEDTVKVGDYITLAGQTPVPNIPTEMHPLLAQAAAVQILESLSDDIALKNAQIRLDKMTRSIQKLVDNRVDFAPKKIKPRHSTLRSSAINKRRNR